MNDAPSKRKAGRPKTGRELARYWLKRTTIDMIHERAKRGGFERDADYLEQQFYHNVVSDSQPTE